MRRKVKWTKETIPKEAKRFKTRNEFKTKSGRAYHAAKRLSILDEVCSHMPKPKRWTKETILKEAQDYKTRNEFKIKSNSVYNVARRLGILDEVCSHMVCGRNKIRTKWTKEKISKEAKNYKTRSEFSAKRNGAYDAAKRLSILDEVCSHMVCGKRNRNVIKFPNKKTNINNTKKTA